MAFNDFGQNIQGLHQAGDSVVSTDRHIAIFGEDKSTNQYAYIALDASGQVELAHDVNTNPIYSVITDGTDDLQIVVDGSAVGTNGIHLLGTDGTNAQILSTDSNGQLELAHDVNTNPIFGVVTDGTDDLAIYNDGDTSDTGVGVMGKDASGNMHFLKVASDGELIINIGAADSAYVYGSTNLVKDTATTVVTESPGSTTKYIGIKMMGIGLAEWYVKFGVTGSENVILASALTPSNPSEYIKFPAPLEVASGETILVEATNRENPASPASDFTGHATLIKEA